MFDPNDAPSDQCKDFKTGTGAGRLFGDQSTRKSTRRENFEKIGEPLTADPDSRDVTAATINPAGPAEHRSPA